MTVSFVVSFYFLKPVYKAETTLFVGKEGNKAGGIELGEIKLNDELVSDYRAIITSRLAAREVIDKLELDMSVESFQRQIEVTTASNSRLMKISCEDTDPQLAMNIANSLADFIIVKADEIMDVENVKIIDLAELPAKPIKPNKKMNLAIAAVLGVMLAVGLIFLMEYLDSTIKNKKDVARYLGINVIGEIPEFTGEERGFKRGKYYKEYYEYRK